MSTEKKSSARDRILGIAGPLFYTEGYRVIGIDRIIAESGVAKASFYKHFPAKDDLIVAVVTGFEAAADENLPGPDVPDPLFAYADALIDIAESRGCCGCPYQGTAAEFSDPAHPAHAASIGVKSRTLAALRLRAERQGLPDPEVAAETVFLLLEGVWAAVRMLRQHAPLGSAKLAVRKLVG